ncbi:acyl-CoA dehydrogenase family protein [Mycetocola spongiae]|uniref:acyl-CoA dehydrogenase family protein n=1 Tax=Mycetocola spongiae TaxID=2859226 RepID=UPI001CF551CB|nr:acyl-CoA dehydrogenase family protein [Mycetocola spongiae]UCR88096.1 acyl-CoA dehydrogenase family protein [Mycetocola spongiae]
MTETLTSRSPWHGTADPAELAHWRAVAETVAATLAVDAVERDRANLDPHVELELLRSSGLVNLLIPAEYGGGGAHWESAFLAIRILARADASVSQVLAYHYVNSAGIVFNLPGERQAEWFRRSAAGNWVWGDSVNPVDPALSLVPHGEGYILNGLKRFSTGASVGDVTLVNARVSEGPDTGRFAYAVLEHTRAGVHYLGDWDALGQRLSASGSVRFTDVRIEPADLLGLDSEEPFSSLVTPGIQLAFGNLYLGIAEGALERGTEILRARANAWFLSSADLYRNDPFVQRTVGEFVSRIAAAEALADRVNVLFDRAIERGADLTAAERGEIAIQIAQLKVVTDDVAVTVANRIFEVTGSSSALTRVGLDIYWRNIRTHSLHDPVDYKKLEVGAHYLNGELQPISLYT